MMKANKIIRAEHSQAAMTGSSNLSEIGSTLQAASREFLEAARLVEKKNWKELLPRLQSAGILLATAGSELERQAGEPKRL
jgi:hypothetical protein